MKQIWERKQWHMVTGITLQQHERCSPAVFAFVLIMNAAGWATLLFVL